LEFFTTWHADVKKYFEYTCTGRQPWIT